MLVWSYHWWSRYPFVLVPLWEWIYSSPQHTLGYCYNHCFGEWNTCSKGGFPPFPLPHSIISRYSYYQRHLLYFDGHCHYWPNSQQYGVMNIDDDCTCNDDGYLGEDTILHWTNIKWWFHSFYNWDIWVFPFLFRFIPDCFCTNHYHVSSMVFFNPFYAHFSLLITCVHYWPSWISTSWQNPFIFWLNLHLLAKPISFLG